MRTILLLAVLALLSANVSCGAAEPAAAPSKAEAGAKPFSPTDLEGLRGKRGEQVVVEGDLVLAGESKSKTVRFLNFTKEFREGIALVFFVGSGGDQFSMEKLQSWVGKKVRVTGKVSEYGSNMQIQIENWNQVQELPKSPATGDKKS